MCALFRNSLDTQSQLDYKLTYWPRHMLGSVARSLIFEETGPRVLRKENFLAGCNETMTHFTNLDDEFKIVWLFNNVPSKDEWERKSPTYLLTVSTRKFRHADRKDVIILSFCSPTEAAAVYRRNNRSNYLEN